MVSFLYRLAYIRLNPYSEESILAGAIYVNNDRLAMYAALDVQAKLMFEDLFGQVALEQVVYAIELLRSDVSQATVDWIQRPTVSTDLLRVGELNTASAVSIEEFMRDFLRIASCLRNYSLRPTASTDYQLSQTAVSKLLRDDVIARAPAIGARLFGRNEVPIGNQRTLQIPLFGTRVFGSPLSMCVRDIDNVRLRAEALIAKYNHVRRIHALQPALYVLAPFDESSSNGEAGAAIDELTYVAEANNVMLRVDTRVEALGEKLLLDEAA